MIKTERFNVRTLVSIGMLSSISYLLMLLNFPLPLFPNFLFIDFSDIPALIATIMFGPLAGIIVVLLKNVINFLMLGSPTGVPVGHIANFLAGTIFILPTYFVYKKIGEKKGLMIALGVGTIVMSVVMSILNYFLILPAYTYFLQAPDMRNLVVPAIFPFNLIKGVLMSSVFILVFVRIKGWITRFA
ncbi:ECF transporter S component [Bacillus sp. BGMRC 2118]|nr:ECF transporter S component [Bacillus sp. BGMRC 2118]